MAYLDTTLTGPAPRSLSGLRDLSGWGNRSVAQGISSRFDPNSQAMKDYLSWLGPTATADNGGLDAYNGQLQQGNSVQMFVDKLSKGNQPLSDLTSKLSGDYANYSDRMKGWLDAPAPVANNNNRFEAGLSANERRLEALLENPDAVQQTAAYKFRVGQGQEAINRNLAAKGMLNSGNRLQELTRYGQDMASQEYDNQAKRLADLVANYSTSWLGDKNANTARYAAEANAWNQRGGLLADLVGKGGSNAIAAQKVNSDDRLGWGQVWSSINRGGGPVIRGQDSGPLYTYANINPPMDNLSSLLTGTSGVDMEALTRAFAKSGAKTWQGSTADANRLIGRA